MSDGKERKGTKDAAEREAERSRTREKTSEKGGEKGGERPSDHDDPLFDETYDFDAEFAEEVWKELPHEDASKLLRGLEGLVPDILKRSVLSGLSNLIMSEDGIRSVVAEKSLPKEAAAFVLGQADATRREILRIVSREIRIFLEDMDFGGEIAKILTSLSFEVRTEIRFIPNDERVKPNIRNRVTVKRARDGKSVAPEDEVEEEGLEEASAPGPVERNESEEREERGRRRWTRRKRRDEAEPDDD